MGWDENLISDENLMQMVTDVRARMTEDMSLNIMIVYKAGYLRKGMSL